MPDLYILLATWLPDARDLLHFLRQDALKTDPDESWTLVSPSDFPKPEDSGWRLVKAGEALALEDEKIFFWLDPRQNLLGQIDAYAEMMQSVHIPLARWITIADMEGIENHHELYRFYQLALQFTDILLLGHRDAAGKKFIRDFERKIDHACLPLLRFWLKKEGKVEDPTLLLYPDSLRISTRFDLPETESDQPAWKIPEIVASWEEEDEEESDLELFSHPLADLDGKPADDFPNVQSFVEIGS